MKGEAPRGWVWRLAWLMGFASFPYVTVLGAAHRPGAVPPGLWFTLLVFGPVLALDVAAGWHIPIQASAVAYYLPALVIALALHRHQRRDSAAAG